MDHEQFGIESGPPRIEFLKTSKGMEKSPVDYLLRARATFHAISVFERPNDPFFQHALDDLKIAIDMLHAETVG